MIKVNDLQVDTGDYITSSILHDQANDQDLNLLSLTRQDGAKLISSTFLGKNIVLKGTLKGTDQADLEDLIDTFKKSMSVTDGKLIVSYGDGYRLYKVNTKSISITREHYHITYAPFEVSFVACDPPFGLECDVDGDPIVTTAVEKDDITSDSDSEAIELDGSAAPRPIITITVNTKGDITSFDLINNAQQLSFSPTLADGDVIVVDTDQAKITHNGEDVVFSGVLPSFLAGTNNLDLSIYSSTGTTLDQSQTINNATKPIYGSRKIAQSFEAGANGIIPKISLLLGKVGTLANDLTVRIETDNSGSPSGTLVTGGSITVSKSEVTSAGWINKMFTAPPACVSGTTYWIVAYTSGGDPSNAYLWSLDSTEGYADGEAKLYTTSWASITGDMCFKIYKNVLDQNNSNETSETSSEDFTATTNKDAANTTADWSGGELKNVKTANAADQSQTTGSDSAYYWGGDSNNYKYYAQTFVPSEDCLIETLDLYLKRASAGTTGKVYAAIYATSGGVPTSQIASFGYVLCSALTTSYAFVQFTGSAALSSETTYAIVVRRDGNDNSEWNSVYWGLNAAGGYASGSAYRMPSATWSSITGDFAFKTYKSTYADGVGQSNALDSVSSDVIAAVLSVADTKPSGCSIAYQLASDGTNFEDVAEDTEVYLCNVGSALKFKVTLSGTASSSPSVQSLSLTYKTAARLDSTAKIVAQSFVPGQTGNLGRLEMMLKKIGTPGNITVEIRSDNSGSPSASVLATQTISASDVLSSAMGWVACNFASPAGLTASTTYWIVVYAASVSSSSAYWIRTRPGDLYAAGELKYSTDSGANYSAYSGEDILFKTYPSSGNAHNVDLKVDYTKRHL